MYKDFSLKNLFGIFIIVMLFSTQQVIGQENTISGKVVVFDSLPIAGALVQVKGSKQKNFTDSLGHFEFKGQLDDKLTVSAKGFYSQKPKLDPAGKPIRVNLKLKNGDRNLDMAIENGHVVFFEGIKDLRKLENDKGMDFSQYTSFRELIAGRFPNVEFIGEEIIIRGTSSINSSSAALIVLDGSPSTSSVLSSLSPAQIKSIDIVTGASASRYGPGSGNGVVVILTKGITN